MGAPFQHRQYKKSFYIDLISYYDVTIPSLELQKFKISTCVRQCTKAAATNIPQMIKKTALRHPEFGLPRSGLYDSGVRHLTGGHELVEPEELIPGRARKATEAHCVCLPGQEV